jgi:hypothetical protein
MTRDEVRDLVCGPIYVLMDDVDSKLKGLGFDGYAIDYVDCPDGLLWFLKRDLNLHRTVRSLFSKISFIHASSIQAIGLNGNGVDVASATQAVSRFEKDGRGGSASFIAGSTMNIVARSQYGKRLTQNLTRDVQQARNLVNSASEFSNPPSHASIV